MIIGVFWFLISLFSMVLTQEQDNILKQKKTADYIEKIDNFSLQAFNEQQQITYFIKANNYFSFKDKHTLLLKPKISTYNKDNKIDYILTSARAHYLDNGDVQFKGQVNIQSKSGVFYKINTKSLLVSAADGSIIGDEPVTYLEGNTKVTSEGIKVKSQQDIIRLVGKVHIDQGAGKTILTRDLFIDQSNSKKHYYSKNNTTYLTASNKINAQGIDINVDKKITTLLGKVRILQGSGVKIDTENLLIDQSNENEVYQTKKKVHYRSKVSDIRAIGMRYDVKNQKIKLTGGVSGRYE
ncbi:hypothetical protein SPONN_1579 [uncultured Candidatus Thioglobus sp.]|nr:hypothetical protein SPONL_71 [uncultured Candidatus Thioglobus sp.]SMN02652.1 hypothetical protein SPONN_1579 [uncultured Candidatus Thioglobus sp.]